MAERSVVLRLATKDGELVKRALTSLGDEGAAALKRLEQAGQPASRGLKAVDAAAKEARNSVDNLAERAGAGASVLRALGPAGLVAAAAIGTLVIAFGAVMTKAREAVDYFDELQDAADRLGVGTEWLQGIRYSVGQAGGDVEKVEAALDRLNSVMGDVARGGGGEAAKAFKQLGVNVMDAYGNVKSLERVLPEFADGYQKLSGAQERASVATDLFGRGNQAFARILVEGGAALERQIQLAREMGAVVDSEIVRKGAEAKDRLEALAMVIKAQLYSAVIDAVPAIIAMAEAFASAARWAGATADAWNDLPMQRLDTMRDTLRGLKDELQSMKDNKGGLFGWSDADIAKQEALIQKYEAAIEQRRYQDFEGRRATGMTSPDPKTLGEYSQAVQQVIDDLKVQEEQAKRTGEALAVYNALLKVPNATLEERKAVTEIAIATYRAEEAKRKAKEAETKADRDAQKDANEAEREHQRLLAEGERVTLRLATAEEARVEALKKIAELEAGGAIDATTADRARKAADLEYFKDSKGPAAGLVQGLDQLVTMTGDAAGQVSDLLTGAYSGIEDAFVEMIRTQKVSFRGLVDSMLEDLARLAARAATNALFQLALNAATAYFAPGLPAGVGAGTNGLGSLTYGGPRAGGGQVDPYHYYRVNEYQQEFFAPTVPGRVVPAIPIGGGASMTGGEGAVTLAPQFTIDARGAAPGVEMQIQAAVNQATRQMKADLPGMIRDARRRALI